MFRRFSLMPAVLAAAVFASPAAWAQLFADEAAREQAVKNAEEINTLKGVIRDQNEIIQGIENRNADFLKRATIQTQKIQGIEEQLRSLAGRIDESQKRYESISADETDEREKSLTNIKREMEGLVLQVEELAGQVSVVASQMDDLSESVVPPDEETMYVAAVDLFQGGDYAAAADGFSKVLRFYPDGEFGASAWYWLGESYLLSGDYERALESANQLIQKYPASDKQPEGYLIAARALLRIGRPEDAKTQLEIVIEEYPTSLAADKARQLLRSI